MKDPTKDALNELAELCDQTTGAFLVITRLKDRTWQVAFPNSGKLGNHRGKDVYAVILEATKDVLDTRVPIETETKYTVYDQR